tara:strand:- start:4811 stop:5770 length:960 start_codon:yes stop_codon:yes gene_type:complete
MSRTPSYVLIFLLFSACTSDDKKNVVDVSDIEVDFSLDRFDQKFYTAKSSDLNTLKKEYPRMLSGVEDSIWLNKMKNEDELHLFNESQKVFGNFSETKSELEQLFKHIKYYTPTFKAPNIITHISNLDYDYPVIYADTLLFVALDMYLGKNNIVYSDFPKYISQNYVKEAVVVDAAKDIINLSYRKEKSRTFLERMINEGKFLYLLDRYLPNTSDELKMNYDADKMEFVQMNEINIWKYFIENELLFSNDSKLNTRFIDVAPFSKFYKEFDQETPGRVGVWTGWQIVRAYMKNNDVTLQQLMATSPETIYKKSKYKPRK